jgi:hypothetical protein
MNDPMFDIAVGNLQNAISLALSSAVSDARLGNLESALTHVKKLIDSADDFKRKLNEAKKTTTAASKTSKVDAGKVQGIVSDLQALHGRVKLVTPGSYWRTHEQDFERIVAPLNADEAKEAEKEFLGGHSTSHTKSDSIRRMWSRIFAALKAHDANRV